jgi:hypothetical protein
VSKKRTGLGTDAFFQQPEPADEERLAEQQSPGQDPKPEDKQPKKSKSEKVRTTVTLYPETLAGMEMLKVQARLEGEKATFSDILNEAVQDLMDKKGVELP